MDRAVPSTCSIAPSMSTALRSGILVSAICFTCARVTEPAFSRGGTDEPSPIPAACRSRNGVGGVLVMNENERSSKIEISTGTIEPRCDSVRSLYALQKSMMLMPWGPSAVPTGGAGVACPAGIWIFTTAASFFFAILLCSVRWNRSARDRVRLCLPAHSAVLAFGSRPRVRVSSGSVLLRPRLELRDLAELELDRGLATEDVDEDLELGPVDVDLADRAVEVRERAGHDPHLLALLVLQPRARLLLRDPFDRAAGAERLLDLAAGERRRLGAAADEAGDAGRVPHHVPGLVVEAHPDQQVARPDLLLD